MHDRRIPPAVIPVAAFFAAGIIVAVAHGALTMKGLLIGLLGAIVIVLAASSMHRGPYI
jgi:hypothetical protein